ncbi:SusC/RagA family TonB-linked outer membrane protein [Reichenbachiella agarivorans]|uniref:SusC/RagA family TonB-linked outer membrane protein n=1 Tax=Reichenbachiella agarivorans TaxID=2979464 RepID=A0ABY6CPH0_9BACT|nr:SusC/RagA family TonB-linked outer membrane protein [Reichenbachiella agarivorans]UXP32405.1 SusC/RagA family TonB-linked outer membrane protein [Reichenbachiella agarivorans]
MIKRILMMSLALCTTLFVQAQTRTVSGKLTDSADGATLPGVNVLVKGTSTGTVSDMNGAYSLEVSESDVLVFSFIGYVNSEQAVGSKSVIDVAMVADVEQLDEVVVTALGIVREERSLSYAAAQVDGDELAMARESNIVNNLSGKVPGVSVSPSGSGMGGSSKVTIRGNSFLSGNNQPLIVVDGVPIDNMGAATDNTWGDRQIDYGNGLNDINMDDVESVSVLKGPAASALYGSRAGNGVIMITTKSAKSGTSGVSFNSNTVVEIPREYLEMQNKYGQGSLGVFDPTSGASWGPEMTGQEITDWTGETKPMEAKDNDIRDFLQNGLSTVNTIEMYAADDVKNIRASVGYTYNKGVFPTSNIKKINAALKGGTKLGKSFETEFSMNYNNTQGENRIKLARDPDNPYYSYAIMPRSISYSDLENNVRDDVTYAPLRWNANGGVILNPYFTTAYNTNEDARNRFIGYGKLIYNLGDHLTFHVRYGMDHYDMRQRDQLGTGVPYWFNSGDVKQILTSSTETNVEFMGMLKPIEITGGLKFSMTLGGNLLEAKSYSQTSSANGLVVPDFYSINNSSDKDAAEYIYRKSMNSVFGMAQLSFKEMLFLDITERIDWSSTLPEDNRNYDYPSIGLSWVISDSFDGIPSWISLAKVRGSYAVAGKDAEPYSLQLTNTITQSGAAQPTTKPNNELKRELVKSKEVGADLNLFNNRFTLAYTYYHNNTVDQIMPIPVNPATGFTHEMVNAGNMQNSGHEVGLNIGLVNTQAFKANVGLNWAKNINKIIELHEGLDTYLIGDGLVQVVAEEGGAYGDIYGYTFLKDDNGQLILNGDGQFQRSTERVKMGNFNPDWNAGITGSASYTGDFGTVSFSILFDYMKGGDIYSLTNSQAAAAGTSAVTAENDRAEYTITGVDANGAEMTGTMTAQQYWTSLSTIDSEWVYDKSEVNLRELTVGYSIPSSKFGNSGIRGASLSLVGRNLATFGSKLNGIPPYAYTTSNQQGAEAYSAIRTATIGFNLKLQF